MSGRPGFCGKHQLMIGQRLRFLGLSRFISKTPEQARAAIVKWLAGNLPREEMDPLAIIMLELKAHADRVAVERGIMQKGGTLSTCALCAVQRMTDDEGQDVRSLHGYGQIVLRLFQSNGLVNASDGLAEIPEPKMHRIQLPRGVARP